MTTRRDDHERKVQFLACLLSGQTIKEASKSVGISEVTGSRWGSQDATFNNYRREVVGALLEKMAFVGHSALKRLEEIMADPTASEQAQIAAAKIVLDGLVKLQPRQLEVEAQNPAEEAIQPALSSGRRKELYQLLQADRPPALNGNGNGNGNGTGNGNGNGNGNGHGLG